MLSPFRLWPPNALFCCEGKRICSDGSQRRGILKSSTIHWFSGIPPSFFSSTNWLTLRFKGLITLTARLGEFGPDGNFYPLEWPTRQQIIASLTLYVDSKKPRRAAIEQRYLGIDPRVGLAYNRNLVALSVVCTPTPALLETKVFFARMELEAVEQVLISFLFGIIITNLHLSEKRRRC